MSKGGENFPVGKGGLKLRAALHEGKVLYQASEQLGVGYVARGGGLKVWQTLEQYVR